MAFTDSNYTYPESPAKLNIPFHDQQNTNMMNNFQIKMEKLIQQQMNLYHQQQSNKLAAKRNILVLIGFFIGIIFCYTGLLGILVGFIAGIFVNGSSGEVNSMLNYVDDMKKIISPIIMNRWRTKSS